MRRTVLLQLSIATLAMVISIGVALVIPVDEAQATFPGPNGKIVFTSERNGNPEVYAMNPDGSNQTNLTKHASIDNAGSWSPDGTKIAFTSYRDASDSEVYTMDAGGGNPTRLTDSPQNLWDPAWSPDGTKIAFQHSRPYQLYAMGVDGSGQTLLTPEGYAGSPDWSPDGTKIAYAGSKLGDGSMEIYVMSNVGSNHTNLTNNAAGEESPSWSPDGTRIAFTRETELGGDVWVMNADGSNQTRLTDSPAWEGVPTWSPDGAKIAFVKWDSDNDIWVMNADGSNQMPLTQNSAADYAPSWGVPAPDTEAPRATVVKPANRATAVSRQTNVRASFSEKMDRNTLAETTFQLYKVKSDGTLAQLADVKVTASPDGMVATLNPYGTSATLLAKRSKYKAIVTTEAEDLAGNALDQSAFKEGNQQKVWYFTTGG